MDIQGKRGGFLNMDISRQIGKDLKIPSLSCPLMEVLLYVYQNLVFSSARLLHYLQ